MIRNRFVVGVAVAGALLSCGAQAKEAAVAIFAGGCFWSVESDFDHAPGVLTTTTGYIGGKTENPTYAQVSTETTGHREAVRVTYDPSVTSYAKLLDAYWHFTNPTDGRGQFCDFASSYRPGLYPVDKDQLAIATASKADIGKVLNAKIATTVQMAPKFWPAEAYHQNFHIAHADHYKAYRKGCGKNAQVQALWGADAFKGLNGHE